MRSRVNSVSVWFTNAELTKTPFAVTGSISSWIWICCCGLGLSAMVTSVAKIGHDGASSTGSLKPGPGGGNRGLRLRRDAIEDGGEFELAGGPDAVLLLHGLTGSTFEMAPVANRLHRAGFRCLAPLLAGHGGATRDLVGVPWTEWVGKAR